MSISMSNSPRIKEDQIMKLRFISKKFGVPMTRVVRMALEEYFLRHSDVFLEMGQGNVRFDSKNSPEGRSGG